MSHVETVREYFDGLIYLCPADDDGYFSWSPCECCQSPLGGTRYTHHFKAQLTDRETIDANVCTDCHDVLIA
jgi:hypothetical protein